LHAHYCSLPGSAVDDLAAEMMKGVLWKAK